MIRPVAFRITSRPSGAMTGFVLDFIERATGDVQMLLSKPGARRRQFAPL
jgi:hypothetical protein